MWTVIYMAQSKEIVEKLQALLESRGILVKVRPVNKKDIDDKDCCYEVLVPESEVEQAHDIIIDAEL
ncbi:MAG: hypothetical protein N2171_05575 [Clostridia bacterium]|nr:hypothetical protein [Clostridia bacterium]